VYYLSAKFDAAGVATFASWSATPCCIKVHIEIREGQLMEDQVVEIGVGPLRLKDSECGVACGPLHHVR
jgi:hypothetical protein